MGEVKDRPVIIMGSHRSGTSLLVKLLRQLGFFAGARLEQHGEAVFFLRINEWLLRRAGGAWDNPLPIKLLYADDELRTEAEKVIAGAVDSRWFAEYTGSVKQMLLGGDCRPVVPWGWKDPRNVFTLGLWLKVFPEAKVLYIRRNGVDVASSLHVRSLDRERDRIFSLSTLATRVKSAIKPFEPYVLQSVRCSSLQESFKLWEEYTAEAEEAFRSFGGDKTSLCYENLLGNPAEEIGRVAEFCGLDIGDDKVGRAISNIRKDRAFAFVRDEGLCRFYSGVKGNALMRKLGYGDIQCQ